MIFETHAHYDDKMFDEDRESLLESMQEAGIGRIVNIGADLASTASSIDLADTDTANIFIIINGTDQYLCALVRITFRSRNVVDDRLK